MNITPQHIMLTLAVIGGIVGLLGYFKSHYASKEFTALKSDVSILQKQMDLFWGVVEKQMSQLLHSPHRPKLDQLLDKNTSGEGLTDREANQLVGLLQKLIDSKELSTDEISWATMLMAVTVAKYRLEQ